MSHFPISEQIIQEITSRLYPEMREHLSHVQSFAKMHSDDPVYENTIDIINELRNEFLSLSNYEIKLLFPTLLKISGTETVPEELCSHISELQLLIRKKEDHLRDLVLQLEVEAEETGMEKEDAVINLLILFRHNFTMQKQQLHKVMMQLQRGDIVDINK